MLRRKGNSNGSNVNNILLALLIHPSNQIWRVTPVKNVISVDVINSCRFDISHRINWQRSLSMLQCVLLFTVCSQFRHFHINGP